MAITHGAHRTSTSDTRTCNIPQQSTALHKRCMIWWYDFPCFLAQSQHSAVKCQRHAKKPLQMNILVTLWQQVNQLQFLQISRKSKTTVFSARLACSLIEWFQTFLYFNACALKKKKKSCFELPVPFCWKHGKIFSKSFPSNILCFKLTYCLLCTEMTQDTTKMFSTLTFSVRMHF